MRKTKHYSLIVCISATLVIVIQECVSAKPPSGSWFSVTSVVHHNEALNRAHDVELSGNLAYVPGKGGSIAVINVADPEKPAILWFKQDTKELSDSETVLLVGNHLLLGTRDFFSINVSNPRQPVFLKKVADRANGRIDHINGMVKRGNYVFAANKAGWINVFDVSDITSPNLFGALEVREKFGLNAPHDVDAFGDYIVIVAPNGFGKNPIGQIAIFKVMDQSGRIIPADQWALAGMAESEKLIGANRVQVSGSFAYTGGSWTPSARKKQGPNTYSDFSVVDISTPENPRIVASVPFSDTRGPNGLTVVGKVAFIASGQSVDAIDISDPYHPVKLGSQKFPRIRDSKRTDNAHDLIYRNSYLYVSCQTDNALMVLKVKDKHIRNLALD